MGAFDFFKKKQPSEEHLPIPGAPELHPDIEAEMRAVKEQIMQNESNVSQEESIPAPPRGNLDVLLDQPGAFAAPQEEMPAPEYAEDEPIEAPFAEDFGEPQVEIEEMPIPRTLRTIKGPVFISLKKYKDLRSGLSGLKQGSDDLKGILKNLKDNRDAGFDLLEKATDNLLKLEGEAERINKLMRN